MEKYIENLYENLVPENRGYCFICKEDLYFPIFKVSLTIIKRSQIRLTLIEEIIMRIIYSGIKDVDEIAGILGLDRSILDITVSELYVKNLVYHTSNNCYLMAKGHEAMRELKTIKRETYEMSNIYINPAESTIYSKYTDDLMKIVYADDRKIQVNFDANNIEFYRNHIGELREIFDKENEEFNSDQGRIPDELISIDNVHDISVLFLKIPVYLYLSENDNDIDLIACNNAHKFLFEKIKHEVIQQIRDLHLLRSIFIKHTVKTFNIEDEDYEEPTSLIELINLYANNRDLRQKYISIILEKISTKRKLIENEFSIYVDYLLPTSTTVDIYVANLDFWSKSSDFINLLQKKKRNVKFHILYNDVGNIKLALDRITRSSQITKDDIAQYNHDKWFAIVFENMYQIIGMPKCYNAINTELFLIKKSFYLNIMNKHQ